MINEILSVGVLLGSLVSPLVNAPADASSSVETSEETTASYTLASTGETFLETDIVWCGDDYNFRPYIIEGQMSDPYSYLDTCLGRTADSTKELKLKSYYVTGGTTQRAENLSGTYASFQKVFSSLNSSYSGYGTQVYDFGNYPYLSSRSLTKYYGVDLYNIPLGDNTLEYYQNLLDFSIVEVTRFAPYSSTLDNSALEMASVCRPQITISADDISGDSTRFKISIYLTKESFRLMYFSDGSLCTSYPSSYSSSSLSSSLYIYPTSWIKTGSNIDKWPAYLKAMFGNQTSTNLYCSCQYQLTTSTSVNIGPMIGKGYYGLAPWYYGEEITSANSMRIVGLALDARYLTSSESLQPLKASYYECGSEESLIYGTKLTEMGTSIGICGEMDWNVYTNATTYVCMYNMDETTNYYHKLVFGPYSDSGGSSDSGGTDAGGNTYYVYNFTDFWWKIIAIPFAFLSQAFNVTLFQGTPYAINITTILFTTLAVIIVVALINLLIKMFKK